MSIQENRAHNKISYFLQTTPHLLLPLYTTHTHTHTHTHTPSFKPARHKTLGRIKSFAVSTCTSYTHTTRRVFLVLFFALLLSRRANHESGRSPATPSFLDSRVPLDAVEDVFNLVCRVVVHADCVDIPAACTVVWSGLCTCTLEEQILKEITVLQ